MDVYSMPPQPPNWDRVGIAYLTVCCTWSTVLFTCMIFMWFNRKTPMLRVRNLPLSFAAIMMLHAYWVMGMVVYPLGRTLYIIPAYDVQYYFMGIWFPLGIALFHASNTQFLYVAKQQEQFAHSNHPRRLPFIGSKSCWSCRFRNLEYPTRILFFIGLGMIFQVLLTVGMWLACRKYHPSFGVPGTELSGTFPEQMTQLGQGWEWWPTALWQVIWTWVVAPIMIWRSWGIRDTLGWRTQVIGCCLSNLHATPLWLVATYLPAFAAMNQYFPPSEWLHVGVTMFEVFTIVIPSIQVIQANKMSRRAASLNRKSETSSQTGTLRTTMSFEEWKNASRPESTRVEHLQERWGDRLLTMAALDYVLESNPGPLQEFSALRDFSGENIAFLSRTSVWKSSWPAFPTENTHRVTFSQALAIYTDFVSPRDAEFPINLSSQDLRQLEEIFEKPARLLHGEARVNPVVPFDLRRSETRSRQGSGSQTTCCNDVDEIQQLPAHLDLGKIDDCEPPQYTGDIPATFSLGVFDKAQTHIKQLVLTNTWPKFVAETHRRRSVESEWSEGTKRSGSSFAARFFRRANSPV